MSQKGHELFDKFLSDTFSEDVSSRLSHNLYKLSDVDILVKPEYIEIFRNVKSRATNQMVRDNEIRRFKDTIFYKNFVEEYKKKNPNSSFYVTSSLYDISNFATQRKHSIRVSMKIFHAKIDI